jgi:hypothetical protein
MGGHTAGAMVVMEILKSQEVSNLLVQQDKILCYKEIKSYVTAR